MLVGKVIIASSHIPFHIGRSGRAFSASAAIMVSCSESHNHNMVYILNNNIDNSATLPIICGLGGLG